VARTEPGSKRAANVLNQSMQPSRTAALGPRETCDRRHRGPVVAHVALTEVACHAGGRGFESRRSRKSTCKSPSFDAPRPPASLASRIDPAREAAGNPRREPLVAGNPRKRMPGPPGRGRLTTDRGAAFSVQADLLLVERAVGMGPLWGFRVRDRLEFERHAMNFTPPGDLTDSRQLGDVLRVAECAMSAPLPRAKEEMCPPL